MCNGVTREKEERKTTEEGHRCGERGFAGDWVVEEDTGIRQDGGRWSVLKEGDPQVDATEI